MIKLSERDILSKLTLYNTVSSDGFIARPDGSEDFISDNFWKNFLSLTKKYKAIILGRKSYETIQSYGEPYTGEFNSLPIKKIVVSKNPNFIVINGYDIVNTPEKAYELCPNALVSSGPTLNDYFLKNNFVGNIIHSKVPEKIGNGILPFNEKTNIKASYETMIKLSERAIPTEKLITNGGFISPDGRYYALDANERHAEWIRKHFDWLNDNGYNFNLTHEQMQNTGKRQLRTKLIKMGWIRTRYEFGILFLTCLDPYSQFNTIKKFFKDHANLYDIKNSFLSIEDIDGNIAEDLVEQIQGKREKINPKEVLERSKFISDKQKERDGVAHNYTILQDPTNKQTIAYVEWKLDIQNHSAGFDIIEIRNDFLGFKSQIEKMFHDCINNELKDISIHWGFSDNKFVKLSKFSEEKYISDNDKFLKDLYKQRELLYKYDQQKRLYPIKNETLDKLKYDVIFLNRSIIVHMIKRIKNWLKSHEYGSGYDWAIKFSNNQDAFHELKDVIGSNDLEKQRLVIEKGLMLIHGDGKMLDYYGITQQQMDELSNINTENWDRQTAFASIKLSNIDKSSGYISNFRGWINPQGKLIENSGDHANIIWDLPEYKHLKLDNEKLYQLMETENGRHEIQLLQRKLEVMAINSGWIRIAADNLAFIPSRYAEARRYLMQMVSKSDWILNGFNFSIYDNYNNYDIINISVYDVSKNINFSDFKNFIYNNDDKAINTFKHSYIINKLSSYKPEHFNKNLENFDEYLVRKRLDTKNFFKNLEKQRELMYKYDKQKNFSNNEDLDKLKYDIIFLNKIIIKHILKRLGNWLKEHRKFTKDNWTDWHDKLKSVYKNNLSTYLKLYNAFKYYDLDKQRNSIEEALMLIHTNGEMTEYYGLTKKDLDYLSNMDTSNWDKQVASASIKLSKKQKIKTDELLVSKHSEIDLICNRYYPKPRQTGQCIPINCSIGQALFELNIKDFKLINGPVLLDKPAFDPEYPQIGERDDGFMHVWILYNNDVFDFADDVFKTKNKENVEILEYDFHSDDNYGLDTETTSTDGYNRQLVDELKMLFNKSKIKLSNRDLYKTAGHFFGAWISPDYKVFEVNGPRHTIWLQQNVYKDFKVENNDFTQFDKDIQKKALNDGWTRLGTSYDYIHSLNYDRDINIELGNNADIEKILNIVQNLIHGLTTIIIDSPLNGVIKSVNVEEGENYYDAFRNKTRIQTSSIKISKRDFIK